MADRNGPFCGPAESVVSPARPSEIWMESLSLGDALGSLGEDGVTSLGAFVYGRNSIHGAGVAAFALEMKKDDEALSSFRSELPRSQRIAVKR